MSRPLCEVGALHAQKSESGERPFSRGGCAVLAAFGWFAPRREHCIAEKHAWQIEVRYNTLRHP